MKQLVLLCGIILSSVCAWSASEIKKVEAKIADGDFTAIYSVSEPIEEKNLKISYRPRSIEMEFQGARLAESKSIVRTNHSLIDRVYTANKDGKVFSRIILKEGMVAEDYKDHIGFEVKGDKILLKFAKNKVAAPVADLDEALEREVAKILSQDMPEKVVPKKEEPKLLAKTKEVSLKESEIPVLTKAAEKKVEAKSPYTRMILSFVVIALFGASMAMASRWWRKRTTKSTDTNKIKLVTQHFLGPKKSLAIVRVAGETMLIGVTDQNINMIKSLSLLDEDNIESIDPGQSFGDVLQSQQAAAPQQIVQESPVVEEEEEDFSFKQIKDRISNRVKEMRPL